MDRPEAMAPEHREGWMLYAILYFFTDVLQEADSMDMES